MPEHDPLVCGLNYPNEPPVCPGCRAEWRPGWVQCLACGQWLPAGKGTYCQTCGKQPRNWERRAKE
jgi:predicted amidophosphoribosyltransferase